MLQEHFCSQDACMHNDSPKPCNSVRQMLCNSSSLVVIVRALMSHEDHLNYSKYKKHLKSTQSVKIITLSSFQAVFKMQVLLPQQA